MRQHRGLVKRLRVDLAHTAPRNPPPRHQRHSSAARRSPPSPSPCHCRCRSRSQSSCPPSSCSLALLRYAAMNLSLARLEVLRDDCESVWRWEAVTEGF
ncbi:hypothetical protein OE88DRAFT_1087993 [Heliocybe sulcata]|uniref:Uncharacterized protein n=1 Tax=Heliocybe sulcata TaxID=5364 RepID=A0A5C3MLV8_9AGAM|nr:hypothetical protein OE88DRAFT_1087993 [Heliocybe sulcata]